MGKHTFIGFITILIVVLLLVYYLVPFRELEFSLEEVNNNFTLETSNIKMQFYENMRFPEREISYNIHECSLKKRNDMLDAFDIVSNLTMLDFYEKENAEIKITCDETTRFKEGLFIAGEGGPTQIVKAGNFNVILSGTILLIRDSKCSKPNVAIHELFHVLGFTHSENKNNIMYNYSSCSQTIGGDNIELINGLYSIESNPDLTFEPNETFATMKGRYLNLNFSIRNNGLSQAKESAVKVYVDNEEIEEVELDNLGIGKGTKIILTNIWVSDINPKLIELVIEADFEELDKQNNVVSLKV